MVLIFLFWEARQDLTQIYGQSAHFCRFVRNQNAFYGQKPILLDVSVNGSDFAKCSAW